MMTPCNPFDSPTKAPSKYAEAVIEWLVELGYTHCFFVAGGNIMHLLDGARSRLTCVPFVHEVAAGIAAEYFNESGGSGRAFALVTAGPGLTNIITAMAGAHLESRELLVIGGQVKSTDLAGPTLRQRGIQEINGVAIADAVCVAARRVERPIPRPELASLIARGRGLEGAGFSRPGPVFIEFCLDAQASPTWPTWPTGPTSTPPTPGEPVAATHDVTSAVAELVALTRTAQRPVWLIGGGVSRATAAELHDALVATGVPVMTTWNGADRIDAKAATYLGRPNTWGQRSANILLQQADAVIALGTRLGLQQTGFNWQQFAPLATVAQVDVDPGELAKGHPHVERPICADANAVLRGLVAATYPRYTPWLEFALSVRDALPLRDPANTPGPGFACPYQFYLDLARLAGPNDIVIPCSSGGANSVGLQAYEPKRGQIMITDKGLASMGYGLSGAIGAAMAHPGRRTFVIEGDGGFAQNLQELATVAVNDLDLKVFIFANEGYGSIRATQRNYFGGAYLGCDTKTGLGFPDWTKLFGAFAIPVMTLDERGLATPGAAAALGLPGPHGFIVPIDPEQTYFPKITSHITASGGMESQPLHRMSPDLPPEIAAHVLRYL